MCYVSHCSRKASLPFKILLVSNSAWDSGAPVILAGPDGPEQDLLVGLGSTGIGCADPVFPAIQARVSTGTDWIRQQVCARSVNPPSDFQCDELVVSTKNATSTAIPASATTPQPQQLANAEPQIGLLIAPLALDPTQFSDNSAVLTVVAFAVFVLLGLVVRRNMLRQARTTCTRSGESTLLNGDLEQHPPPSYNSVE